MSRTHLELIALETAARKTLAREGRRRVEER